jgi:AbrB family looped-hinge helix DNA binding protein
MKSLVEMKSHFAQAKVTARKQIAIPKKVQEKMDGISEGDYLLFYEKEGKIYIEKGALVAVKR